jgi:hypothetical protein
VLTKLQLNERQLLQLWDECSRLDRDKSGLVTGEPAGWLQCRCAGLHHGCAHVAAFQQLHRQLFSSVEQGMCSLCTFCSASTHDSSGLIGSSCMPWLLL